MRPSRLIAFALLAAAPLLGRAESFEADLKPLSMVLRIPDFEQFELRVHPNNAMQPRALLLGTSGTVTLSVLSSKAPPEMSAEYCASAVAGSVIERYAPPLDRLQIVKAGAGAYVLVFPLVVQGHELLEAFVVSGTGKGQCVEVHISRFNPTAEQREAWLQGFRNVRLETR